VTGNDEAAVVVVCVPGRFDFSSNWQLNMESSFKAVRRPESLGGPMRFRLTALAPGFFDDKPEFVRLYVPIGDAKLERLLKGS
jgi:hypothetical protein